MKKSKLLEPLVLVPVAFMVLLACALFDPVAQWKAYQKSKITMAEKVTTSFEKEQKELNELVFGKELSELVNSLTLTLATPGKEPFALTYSMPFKTNSSNYPHFPEDIIANFRGLQLFDNGCEVQNCKIDQQTNGTYLIVWDTKNAASGKHNLNVQLMSAWHSKDIRVDGPVRTEIITNQ